MFHLGNKPFPSEELIVKISQDIIFHYDNLGRDVVFEYIGGEPSLFENMSFVARRLHNHPVNILIKTNGSASLDWWKSARRYLSHVIISVHREHCDIEHLYEVIRFLKNDNGDPIHLEILVPITHAEDSWAWGIETVRDLRKKFGLGNLQMLYSNFGRGSNMYMPYSDQQWKIYKEMQGIQEQPTSENKLSKPLPEFRGKSCYAGIDTMVIDSDGNIWRGWCKQDGKIGSIYDEEVIWPIKTIICNKDYCHNGFDQQARKI
jgi:MoaA/NifB/PqqE/SkfB family radical SAM enzyme